MFPCSYCGPFHPYTFAAPAPSGLSTHKPHNVIPPLGSLSLSRQWHVLYHACAALAAFGLISYHFLPLKSMLQKLQPTCSSRHTPGYLQAPFFVSRSLQFARMPLLSHRPPPNMVHFFTFLETRSVFTSSGSLPRPPGLLTMASILTHVVTERSLLISCQY